MFQARTVEQIQKDVAVVLIVRILNSGSILQQNVTVDSHASSKCRGLPGMI